MGVMGVGRRKVACSAICNFIRYYCNCLHLTCGRGLGRWGEGGAWDRGAREAAGLDGRRELRLGTAWTNEGAWTRMKVWGEAHGVDK